MSNEHLQRVRALTHLRPMLRRLILEAHALQDCDTERAAHLHEAVGDLRTVIARLEVEARAATASPDQIKPAHAPRPRKTAEEHPQYASPAR